MHVDDDSGFLEVTELILHQQGSFQVECVSSVEQAFVKLGEKEFDVVVSDYEMPIKDGLQFLKELRARGNDIPFILFTGKGREEVAIQALNLGVNAHINKQGKPETVFGKLAHAISQVANQRRVENSLVLERERLETVTKNVGAGLQLFQEITMFCGQTSFSQIFLAKYPKKCVTLPSIICPVFVLGVE